MLDVTVESGSFWSLVDEVSKAISGGSRDEAEDEGTRDGSNASAYVLLRAGLSGLADTGARYVKRYVMHQDSRIDFATLKVPAGLTTFPRTVRIKYRLIALI